MEKIWRLKPLGTPADVNRLSDELRIDPALANLLVQRSINTFEEARVYFRPRLDDLHDPFLMKDMDAAVERLSLAIRNGEKIMVYGDYDVDGTTSVALMYTFLKTFYPKVSFYIPDRYTEGYGVSFQGIDFARKNEFSLIVALDCGIKAVEKVEYASECGIDFVICDHHTPGDTIPKAVAVLDPKRADCKYPYKELSGCGVGFKLAQAFARHNQLPMSDVYDLLDFVAISIASDIVPITGENRILQYYGLRKINSNPRTGIKGLMKVAGIENLELKVNDLVFKIGPRINAAGRIDSANKAVKMLITCDEEAAFTIANEINTFNTTRQNLDQNITQEAVEMIQNNPNNHQMKSTVLFSADWHKGVIGIVASRLIESYYRPTVILTQSNGKITGSARSVDGFSIYDAIDACSHLLDNFGGHMYAAGLTIKNGHLQEFIDSFERFVATNIRLDQQTPVITIDSAIEFESINPKFYRILRSMEPFGPENLAPVFLSRGVCDTGGSRVVGKTGDHLKLEIRQAGIVFSGIGFGMAVHYENIKNGQPFDVCFALDENHFRGNTTLQLLVKDIKFPARDDSEYQ